MCCFCFFYPKNHAPVCSERPILYCTSAAVCSFYPESRDSINLHHSYPTQDKAGIMKLNVQYTCYVVFVPPLSGSRNDPGLAAHLSIPSPKQPVVSKSQVRLTTYMPHHKA